MDIRTSTSTSAPFLSQYQAYSSLAGGRQSIPLSHAPPSSTSTAIQPAAPELDDSTRDEFKHQVRMWMQVDSEIKRLSAALRERRKLQAALGSKILEFMKKYNYEELNDEEKGTILQYKSRYVKVPVSQKEIKGKLMEHFQANPDAVALVRKLFEERDRKEKQTLKRITF